MRKIGFDNDKYLREQADYILQRVRESEGKLYLECGGKLLFDYHASRVLPGFEPSVKMRVFESLKDKIDVIICIYAGDIERRKMRSDFGISYDSDVFKMIDDFVSGERRIFAHGQHEAEPARLGVDFRFRQYKEFVKAAFL